MLTFYIIIIILFLLSFTSLIVGVSNDAVNFLNPAVGSKAAKLKTLFILVSIGVILGAVFSNGMMEIARKGIFNPEHFYFDEVMFIFIAVMFTNVILLDAYNTLGLPTSTTVSLVFALLGASVGMALIKTSTVDGATTLMSYINTSKALAIIFGILFSIAIAFITGAFIQWLARLLFTFNYESKLKYFGALFGGISITVIIYFMLIKGVKDASFMTDSAREYINKHTTIILCLSFVVSSIVLEILYLLFRINVFRVVVLVGTMALAMAFAGNDLVNFIGVPLAGLASINIYIESGLGEGSLLAMGALSGPVQANMYILIGAGFIMIFSLWFSKKARSVIKTSIDLSRQGEGHERFGSSLLARQIVRFAVNSSKAFGTIVPDALQARISKRFEPKAYAIDNVDDRPAFDLLRASINLIVASILIALGTSLKLPLSTTYVSFMVAMSTSFADKAWGRESAVYRITGVLSVIGGWFITAIVSFVMAALILVVVYFGGLISIVILVVFTVFFFVRSNLMHRKRNLEQEEVVASISNSFTEETKDQLLQFTERINLNLLESFDNICDFKFKKIKKRLQKSLEIEADTKSYKKRIYHTLSITGISFENSGVYYVQMIDYLRETSDCLKYIIEPAFEHVSNNHKELSKAQRESLRKLGGPLAFYFNEYSSVLKNDSFEDLSRLNIMATELINVISALRSEQIKRIRSKNDPTSSSLLLINILQESENLIGDLQKMIKAYIQFRVSF